MPADTIVLKNGRRIVVDSVSEEGDKIFYEGDNGRVSLPKSLVEKIEKGGPAPARRSSSGTGGAGQSATSELTLPLRLPQPDAEGIVRHGAVDEERLEALAALAQKGDLERQNAVNAHLVAAVFEARQKRLTAASQWAEQALRLSAHDLNALLLAAQIDLARQEHREALDHLLLAESMTPDNADVLTLLGSAYYFSDGPEKALRYWKRAYAVRPDARLQERMQQASREADVEAGFDQAQSGQFTLNWEGAQVSTSFSREVLETLERQYQELEVALDFSPRDAIVVILYAAQQFSDVTQAPGWAGAINDGKIRVPVQGLSSMTEGLARVLQHEMVHSFIHRMTGGRCPTWLNEGIAQLESGRNLARNGPALAGLYKELRQIPLPQLEGSFMPFNSSLAAVAYAESLAAAEMIREKYGAYAVSQLLKALGQGKPMAEALRQVFFTNYPDLEAELANYLAERYGG